MKNRYVRWISILLVLSCIMCMCGCSVKETPSGTTYISSVKPMEKEDSHVVGFDILGGKDVMPLVGYNGPNLFRYTINGYETVDTFSDEMFQKYVDLGINMLTFADIDNTKYPDATIKVLEMAEKYNLGFFPWELDIRNKIGDFSLSATQSAEKIAKWYDYDSFCGVKVVDEPHTKYHGGTDSDMYIDKFGNIGTALNEELDLVSWINMVPTLSVENSAIEHYDMYLEEFISTIKPKLLMWDTYPFRKRTESDTFTTTVPAYIVSLSMVSDKANENDLSFWTFIQVGNQYNDNAVKTFEELTPTRGQFDWNISTALAYGSKGLQFYHLNQAPWQAINEKGDIDPYRSGLIGAMGNKNVWYYYLQEYIRHIKVIDEVLMNSVNKGVIVSGEKAKSDFLKARGVLKGEKFQELKSVDGETDVMIGCFNYNGKTALYVVNYDYEYAQHVTLNFDAEHNITVTQCAEKSYVSTDSLTLDMAAGEGVLLVVE